MRANSDILPGMNRKTDLTNPFYGLYRMDDKKNDFIQNIGSETEKQRLELIVELIEKRKKIRNFAVKRIDDLIVYCDNRILSLGDYFALQTDTNLKRMADNWRQSIIELEKMKISENKELFKDTLFLRNEWIKSLLDYTEEKKLDKLLQTIICS